MEYLAIDFGTANCVAAARNHSGEVELVPLEDNDYVLPTVLFVPRQEIAEAEIDLAEFDKKLQIAKAEDQKRLRKDENDIQEILAGYDARNKPPRPEKPKAPKIEDAKNHPKRYEEQRVLYDEQVHLHQRNVQAYEEKILLFLESRKQYEEKLRASVRSLVSDENHKKIIIGAMQRESSEDAERAYWNQTFFYALKAGKDFKYGSAAIEAYINDPMGGFYLRSPKSFLGADLRDEHINFFENIISNIISHIKLQSERHFKKKFDGVIFGRPVNYHGGRGEKGNQQALEIMRRAAKSAAFSSVKFFLEPAAASIMIDKGALQDHEKILTVDIGGGTTDCAFLNAIDAANNKFSVISFFGNRVGGSDFDQGIAWNIFMPLFGKDSTLKSGLPLPYSLLYDAISTRDLPSQIRFRNSSFEIDKLIKESTAPHLLTRFKKLHYHQLQHKIILASEKIKIGLSEQDTFPCNLDFIEDDLSIKSTRQDYQLAVANQIQMISDIVKKSVENNTFMPSCIFVTGGMSRSPEILESLKIIFGDQIKIEKLDSLAAVGLGLGIVAKDFTEDGEALKLNDYLELGMTG